MDRYIAFIRGINVGGHRKIKMADLKVVLQKAGLTHVQTYIQSGNIIFETTLTGISKLERHIEKEIANEFGFEVPVLVKKPLEIEEILKNNPFKEVLDTKGLYFALLFEIPTSEAKIAFTDLEFEHEDYCYTNNCVYFNCKMGAARAKLNNALIEQKLMVKATTRNLRTLEKVIALAYSKE